MSVTWLPISPTFDVAADRREFSKQASLLAEAARIYDQQMRLAAVQKVRRRFIGLKAEREFSVPLRAAVLVLADLVEQGWSCRKRKAVIEIAKPLNNSEKELERDRIRSQLHVQRDRQLQASAAREFVTAMERRRFHRNRWTSIFSLMRDGADLAEQLSHVSSSGNTTALREVIRPYIQVVNGTDVCQHTGLPLGDIWRYFRYTWANPYRSVPGRSLMFLVRDAAAENHPIIGIAALASSAVQITVRDDWIGWSPESYAEHLLSGATDAHVDWLINLIQNGLSEIYLDDLLDPSVSPLTRHHLTSPTPEVISWLQGYARVQREEHHRFVDAIEHKRASTNGNEFGGKQWREQAETPLFRGKRAETLAMLLRARAALYRNGRPVTPAGLQELLASPEKRQAVQALIRRAKSERVGVAIADVAVCGAVAPYSAILGGKLVSMLMASPEIITIYRERYAKSESVIASSLAGRPIVRSPELVLLATTSLYGTEPSQYTRVNIPCEQVGGRKGESVPYRLLGRTEGYGTFQFSNETVAALTRVLEQSEGGQRVNSIFGEGVNPRLRKIRDGLSRLNLPSELLLSHGSARLVYSVELARNFREYLLGQDPKPDYLLPLNNPSAVTEAIGNWWIERWLAKRIKQEPVLEDVARQRLTYPVKHGARVVLPDEDQLMLPFDEFLYYI